MAADSPNNELYDKIRNYNEEYGINSGLWVQIKGGIESFKSDENSPEDYRDTSIGVMFGLDWFAEESLALGDVMWGVYGRINKNTIEQGSHKAYGNKNGLGVYGGYIKEEWELKGMLLGSFDRFSTERAVMGETAEADINAVTISADAEAALKIELNEVIKFKPYFGIELANTMYGGFKEKGAGIYNLDVNGGSYLRSAARVGAGLNYEKEIWIWYANVEGKYKIEGTKPEIESAFENTGVSFNSRGSEEGRVEAGIGIGAEVRVASDWKIFANGKYYTGERYENLYGNIGMRYMFGKTLESPKETLSKEKPANKEKLTKESVEKNRLVKNDSVLPQQNFVSSDNEKESFSKKTNNKDKSARKEFNKAKRLYNKGEYLRATDMLSEIIASYPDFKLPVQLYAKIQDDMNNTADSREEPDFSKITYAKGYCSYYKEEYNNALTEWDKYILFAGKNKELLEYIDKVKNLLNFKDFVNREAELDAKANEMLNEGIKKYKAARWMLCIRDMETLQKFVTENKFSGTDEYYIRAKEYIDLSVNELAKTIKKAEKKEDKKPDPQDVEKKPEIDEAASDQKYNEGLTQYAQGKYLEAERTWELTLRLNPNHQKAKIALSRLRSSGHLAE
ncbi:MAG: autotransporter outer membrane beta-barrel domain-containing protein [Endomicrobia bacterium]|nr:autotransporter outer membrane beta-barrel domain-containing protein [Endomicrobiia bacterium]